MAIHINLGADGIDEIKIGSNAVSQVYLDGERLIDVEIQLNMLVVSPVQPAPLLVEGGTVDIVEESAGNWRITSYDAITRINLGGDGPAVNNDVTEIHVIKGDTLTSLERFIYNFKQITTLTWSGVTNPAMTSCRWMCFGAELLTTFDVSTIDFSNVTNFEQMFSNTLLNSVGYMGTQNGELFEQMFSNMQSLVCISIIDTRNQTSTANMFYSTPSLVAPDATDQAAIMAGALWTNPNPCPQATSPIYLMTEPLVDDGLRPEAPIYNRTEALVYVGDPMIIENSTFDSNIDGWDQGASSVNSWVSGELEVDVSAIYNGASQVVGSKLEIGIPYIITVDCRRGTAGNVVVGLNDGSWTILETFTNTSMETKTFEYTSNGFVSTTIYLMTNSTSGTAYFDNVYIRKKFS